MKLSRCKRIFVLVAIIVALTFILCGCEVLLNLIGQQDTQPVKQYTVVFNYNYPVGQSVSQTFTVSQGDACTLPDAESCTGYVFDGWFWDEDCTKQAVGNISVTQDVTLYGGWTRLPFVTEITASYVGQTVYVGDSIAKDGFVVTAIYNNGTTQVCNDFDLGNVDTSSVGDKQVTVTWQEFSTTVQVTVCPIPIVLQSIGASFATDKTYYLGDMLVAQDLIVTANYSDGTNVSVQDFDFVCDLSQVGNTQVIIGYQGFSAQLQLTVVAVQVTEITADYCQTEVKFSQQINATQITVTAHYNNGTTEVLTDNWQIVQSDLNENATCHTLQISASINGQSYNATLVVDIAYPTSIQAQYGGSDVFVNHSVDLSCVTVTAVYQDGSTEVLPIINCSLEYDNSTAGEQIVTVLWESNQQFLTDTFTVRFVADNVTSITAVHDDHIYTVGERTNGVDKRRITVTLHYQSGATKVIAGNTSSISATGYSNKVGEYSIKVTYTTAEGDKLTDYVTVQVVAKTVTLQSITATYDGTVTQYGKLDYSKFSVTATYSDQSTETVGIDYCSVTQLDSTTVGQKTLTVGYTFCEQTEFCDVTVNVTELPQCDDLQIHFLELGNNYTGDCTLIDIGEVEILIDAGSRKDSANAINSYVKQYCDDGVIEYVIATHAHQDHIAGFVGSSANGSRTGVLYQNSIGTIIQFSNTNATSQIYKDYVKGVEYATSQGTTVYSALDCVNNDNGGVFQVGQDVYFTVLYQDYYTVTTSNENNYSVCILLTQGDNHYLFTGDLEGDGELSLVENNPDLPTVELYKGGHHGSYTAATDVLLSVIQPKNVCICCCAGAVEYTQNLSNTFPAQAFINRIANYTDNVYVTTMGYVEYNESKNKYTDIGFASFNGNIVVDCKFVNGTITVTVNGSNNNTKLKDTEWFGNNRICPDAWK